MHCVGQFWLKVQALLCGGSLLHRQWTMSKRKLADRASKACASLSTLGSLSFRQASQIHNAFADDGYTITAKRVLRKFEEAVDLHTPYGSLLVDLELVTLEGVTHINGKLQTRLL